MTDNLPLSSDSASDSFGPPFAIVRALPFTDNGLQIWLPVIFVSADNQGVKLNREALVWARASLSSRSIATIHSEVRTLARFIDFYHAWGKHTEKAKIHVEYIIYAYLATRSTGTRDTEGRSTFFELSWPPLSTASLKNEFGALIRFFQFCSATFNYLPLSSERFPIPTSQNFFKSLHARQQMKEADLLAHLAASRQYWSNLHGEPSLYLPPIIRRPPKTRRLRQFPTSEEIWAVIHNESNPIYKSLWLAAAFGGLRISEQLNAWQIDILPASYRRFFFEEDTASPSSTILFLRADPTHSRYVEAIGASGPTRRQFLKERYGLVPRCELTPTDPLRAGWKGTICTGEHLTHQVFWIDEVAAIQFAECALEIRDFHHHHRTSRRHPWYYVNIADRTQEYRGLPIKVGRVERALEAAYRRVGLVPHEWGHNLHGFRHYYKWFASNELSISSEHIQIMLGHRSRDSQNEYGRNAQATNLALDAALEKRRIPSEGGDDV